MKNKKIIGAVIALALVAVVALSLVVDPADDVTPVYVEEATRGSISTTVSAPGEIDPKVKVNISSHVIGKIERLYFAEGDWVEKGDRMVELERVSYEAARDRTAAQLRNANIEVERAEITLRQRRQELERAERLRAQGIQAEELYERAQLEFQNARANLAAAREGVFQARANLQQVDDDLSRTTILAPISGRVVDLQAEEGEVVVTGTMNNPGSVIAVVADLSDIMVEARVGETEIVEIELGQPAEVEVDAIRDEIFDGQVVEIGSSAEVGAVAGSGIRTFTVNILLNEQDERLRPGMTATVDIVTESSENVVRVPVQSVLTKDRGEETERKVVPIVQDDRISMIEVETGVSDATHIALVSGLEGGELVVTGPYRTLRDLREGDLVKVENEESEADDEEEE